MTKHHPHCSGEHQTNSFGYTPNPLTAAIEEWKKPDDFQEFEDAAIAAGVPASLFWDDAEHCSCFYEGPDGEDYVLGPVHGMYNLWQQTHALGKQEGMDEGRGGLAHELLKLGEAELRDGVDTTEVFKQLVRYITNVAMDAEAARTAHRGDSGKEV